MNKKYGFIPNRLNKYSIRRFTVGTASILVGATLLFGLGQEAKADEITDSNNDKQSTQANSNNDTANTTTTNTAAVTEEKAVAPSEAEATEEKQ